MLTFEKSSPSVVKCDFIKLILQNDYLPVCLSLFCIYFFLLCKVSPKISFSDLAQISLKENFYSGDCSFVAKKK